MSDDSLRELALHAIQTWMDEDKSARVYAVVDACQAWELLVGLQSRSARPLRNLFKGTVAMSPGIQTVAPTFVPLDSHAEFLREWLSYLDKHAGVLIRSRAKPIQLFKHLRRIFVVQDANGQEHFFRFYDPRVLRVFLRASTADELAEFFGPIDECLIEGRDVDSLETFQLQDGRLHELAIALSPDTLQESTV